MRIDVYAESLLVASFEYLDLNTFYGAPGLRVRELVSAARPVHNPWTGEDAPEPSGWTADWWAATILSAGLEQAGYRLVLDGLPPLSR